MKLPNREQAFVPEQKLTDYLLSQTHPVGKAKAQFFRAVGFDETNVSELEQALLMVARTTEVSGAQQTPHGTKYIIEGDAETPSGRLITLRTVWIIADESDRPRFVTAYPA